MGDGKNTPQQQCCKKKGYRIVQNIESQIETEIKYKNLFTAGTMHDLHQGGKKQNTEPWILLESHMIYTTKECKQSK